MLKIAYDGQIFSTQTHGGVSRLYSEIIKKLRKQGVEVEVFSKLTDNAYFSGKDFLRGVSFPGKINLMKAVNSLYSIRKLREGNFDVFHPTNFNPYFLDWLGDKPLVVTVYDLTYEKIPNYFSEKSKNAENKKKILERANAIIAISHNTKNDLEDVYGLGAKTTVIYLANSLIKIRSAQKIDLPDNYLLYVGARGGYKNFVKFISSLPMGAYFVVCVGGGDFTEEEKKVFSDKGVSGRIVHFSATDRELPQLYERATAFVYPSLYEGFGIPLLEAFAFGCPVIASNTSSLPEIGGDACLYFDPTSTTGIRNAIEQILKNKDLREKLVAKGFKRERMFSWEKTAQETLKLYAKVVQEP